ncbi:MAG TPA: polysaccharide deacetylase family protein [Micromonosporaceae bacterium]|nr:polysaccharide deacetylase family protein [Micromonosporaceae bacterium]
MTPRGIRRRDLLWVGGALAGLTACGTTAHTTAAPPVPRPTRTPTIPPSPPPTAAPALPAEVTNGPRTRPAVALTFHGQGTHAQVEALLQALERGGAKGTVLAVGTWLSAQPAMARRILDAGHDLGNHTQHHLALSTMAAGGVYREIDDCAAVLRRLTGGIGSWFRPSQTVHADAVIRAQATRVGYRTCLSYDVDSLDYTDPGPAAIVATTLRQVRPGSIVSLHCGHPGTVAAMPALLDGLGSRGLRPVTVTELLAP